jgi:DNA-binding IclR family transcriptional regulator
MAAEKVSDNLVGTLERGLAILQFFKTAHETSIQDLADSLHLSRSTTYRLVERLRELGFLEVNAVSGRLRLGLESMQIGVAALQSTDVMRIAPEYLRTLSEQAEASANLAVFDVDRMVLLHREQGPHAVTVSARLGSYRPMQASSLGKAYLAAMSASEREALISRLDFKAYTPSSITDAQQLRREIAEIRDAGYAVDRAEFEQTLSCCAAAVFDHRRQPVAVVSVSGLTELIAPRLAQLGPLVHRAAQTMSARLGCIDLA